MISHSKTIDKEKTIKFNNVITILTNHLLFSESYDAMPTF